MIGARMVTGRNVLDELMTYVRFDVDVDGAALRALAPHARLEFRRITDEFYARLAEHPDAAAVFTGPAQVERLKGTLVEWLELLLTGPWDEAYYEKRVRIGKRHVRINLPQRYMFGAIDLVRVALAEIARRVPGADGPVVAATVAAIDKILDVELGVMLESYADEAVEQMRQIERLRREHLAALGTLAAGLAHEIRNPLNAAHLQLTLAQRRLRRSEGADVGGALSASELVASEMARLAGLVEEFLQFARPQPVRRTRTELRALAGGVVELLSEQAAEARVELVLDDGAEVPANVDGERLRQVLLNLVRNAMEAAGAGGHVHLRLADEGALVSLEVLDDGPGLAEPAAPIFEPFFTTKPQGTGLGLSIVHRIVTDHGGEIAVTREHGQTRFRVTLPVTSRRLEQEI
jgi:two-component system sensor histidine kinase HydH